MIQVIQSIQKAKAAQIAYLQLSMKERSTILSKVSSIIRRDATKIAEAEAAEQKLEFELVHELSVLSAAKSFERAQAELETPATEFLYQPTGLISIILPWTLSLRVLAERLAPALAAGNVVLVKTSGQNLKTAEIFREILKESGLPENTVQFISGAGNEIGALMATHPAVQGVTFAGRSETADFILKSTGVVRKKIQFSTSGNNSAILVGDSWSRSQLEILAESCFAGHGQLPWNNSKIFISESNAKKFTDDFIDIIKSRPPAPLRNRNLEQSYLEKIAVVRSEGGQILTGGEVREGGVTACVALDLSHCSTLQQDPIGGPLTLVSPVKYGHEAVKWANVGYLGMSNAIFGDLEKAQRMAPKLECGQVWINRWINANDGVVVGTKQSSYGIMDFGVFGGFYSNRKKVGAQPSTN